MKTRILLLIATFTNMAFPQGGPLTPPPGAPAPTMKSLDQIEPSTPLVTGAPGVAIAPSGTITISQPGAYHLTANLTVTSGNGIAITSDNVTLDLRGFTIATTGNDGIGINISGRTRISIHNGHIRSGTTFTAPSTFTPAGFTGGIDYSGGAPGIIRVSDVSIEGIQNYGIDLGTSLAGIVESCVVRIAQFTGIRAGVVSDSVALLIGEIPITGDAIHNSIGRKIDGTAINTKEEKRTPISSAPFIISQPGSYYLTQNLTVTSGNAITINVGGVTLDLNGFAISSSASPESGTAIFIDKGGAPSDAIIIRNGHIRRDNPNAVATGFIQGIGTNGNNSGIQVHSINLSGTAGNGIVLTSTSAGNSIVENCVVNGVGGADAISATVVRDCVVFGAAFNGITGNTVENCHARSIEARAITGAVVNQCFAFSGTSTAIQATSSVRGCRAQAFGTVATIASPVVTDCFVEATSGVGISGHQISNCRVTTTTGIGIQTSGTASFCHVSVNSGSVAITGPHAFSCTVSTGALNEATNKNFCY